MAASGGPPIEALQVGVYEIPTETPESDATLEWDSTTLVVVHARAANEWGLGYTYASSSTGALVRDTLASLVMERDALSPIASWMAMIGGTRNYGRTGIVSMGISAVDCALWDLKARLLELPLTSLLGRAHDSVPIYGSGGFTSYDEKELAEKLEGWVSSGIPRVKMKVGRDPAADPRRVGVARKAIGGDAELYVDANGGYERKQAIALGKIFAEEYGVTWFEEPRPSDDIAGLRLLRDRAPAGMEVTAGEYGYYLSNFRRLLEAEAVDCLQADVTRCLGVTGLLKVGALAEAFGIPLSGHTAPGEHLHVLAALPVTRHLEYFHDHVRIERALFEGLPEPENGALRPDLTRPGMGLSFKRQDAARYAT